QLNKNVRRLDGTRFLSRRVMTLRIALLTLATEIFREQADQDYVVARACYRMNLREQFLWASLQACEKFLKAILLFNEKSARFDPALYKPKSRGTKNLAMTLRGS